MLGDSPIYEAQELFYSDNTDTYFESTRKIYRVECTGSFKIDAVPNEDTGSFGFFHKQELPKMTIQEFTRQGILQLS